MNPAQQTDTISPPRRYVPTITTNNDRESWERLIHLAREVGPDAVLDSLKTTEIGCVYVIRAKDTEYFKIGFSSTPGTADRIRSMQTGCPHELESVLELSTLHYRYIEKFLHVIFDSKRVRGEWFVLDKNDLETIRTIFNKY